MLAVAADGQPDVGAVRAIDAGSVGRIPPVFVRHHVLPGVGHQHQEVVFLLEAVVRVQHRIVVAGREVLEIGAEGQALGANEVRPSLVCGEPHLPEQLEAARRVGILIVFDERNDVGRTPCPIGKVNLGLFGPVNAIRGIAGPDAPLAGSCSSASFTSGPQAMRQMLLSRLPRYSCRPSRDFS